MLFNNLTINMCLAAPEGYTLRNKNVSECMDVMEPNSRIKFLRIRENIVRNGVDSTNLLCTL